MAVSVDLPEGLQSEMDNQIDQGMYQSKSELIRDAIRRLLEERNKIDHRKLSTKAQRRIDRARNSDKEYSAEEMREVLEI